MEDGKFKVEKINKHFEILLDLHVLMFPVSENNLFRGWSTCICVCYHSKTNYLLESFCENLTNNLYTGTHKRFRKYYGLRMEFANSFQCILTALNIMKWTHVLNMVKSIQSTEYRTNNIYKLSTWSCEGFQIYLWLLLEMAEGFLCSFMQILK